MFDMILEKIASKEMKITYLKIINKNKINIIQYDIVDKLIDIDVGDKIIREFKKDDNSLLNLEVYRNFVHINTIINKCIQGRRVNILDYVLYNLDDIIKMINSNQNVINPYINYFLNISSYKEELEYIELLEVIVKYKYDINRSIILDDTNSFNANTSNEYGNKLNIRCNLLNYCIKKKFNYSSKILITNNIDTNILYEKKTLLYQCVDNHNHIILGYILQNNNKLINKSLNNINIVTYLFGIIKEIEENIFMRFLIKILLHNNFNYNNYDQYNSHIGYLILDSSLTKQNGRNKKNFTNF